MCGEVRLSEDSQGEANIDMLESRKKQVLRRCRGGGEKAKRGRERKQEWREVSMKETEKVLSGFKQHSFENLLEEQNLLSENLSIYKVSYTPIPSAPKSRNPHPELLCSIPSFKGSSPAAGLEGDIFPRSPSFVIICYLSKSTFPLCFWKGILCHTGSFKSSCKQVKQVSVRYLI